MVRYKSFSIHDIPVLQLKPNEDGQAVFPTVFLYHGWASNKETYKFAGEILANRGFQVWIPDLPMHGERDQPKDLQHDFWEIILKAVEEFGALLQFGVEQGQFDPKRTAIVGSSMGGFVASGVFTRYPSIHALISTNGSGAWEVSEHLFREMENRPPATEQELHDVKEWDPITRLPFLPKRPVLLQHGLADSIVPIGGQRHFYKKLLETYNGQGHLVTFQEVPRMDHYISLGMFEDMVDWLESHLKVVNS